MNHTNELVTSTSQLPAALDDLAKFVLVGREKLQSVRAEIRAIDKLQLAEEVRTQKRDEARLLSEALLDAEVRIGELLKQMPTARGGDRRSEDFKSCSGASFENSETKESATQRLGFEKTQVHRFETLAAHPAEVEQIKAEARENDDLPTRTAVLNLIQYKKKSAKAFNTKVDDGYVLNTTLCKALDAINGLAIDRNSLEAMVLTLNSGLAAGMIDDIRTAISRLQTIQTRLYKEANND